MGLSNPTSCRLKSLVKHVPQYVRCLVAIERRFLSSCLRRPRVDRENVGRRGRSILSNFVFIQKDRLLLWVGVLTQSVNLVSGVRHTARYTNSGNQTGKPACVLSRSSYPVQSKTASALLGVHNGTLAHLNQILAEVVVDSSSSGPEDFRDRCTA